MIFSGFGLVRMVENFRQVRDLYRRRPDFVAFACRTQESYSTSFASAEWLRFSHVIDVGFYFGVQSDSVSVYALQPRI